MIRLRPDDRLFIRLGDDGLSLLRLMGDDEPPALVALNEDPTDWPEDCVDAALSALRAAGLRPELIRVPQEHVPS